MENQLNEPTKVPRFGQRKVRPCVLVADPKRHIRTFLTQALEELGFVTCECAEVGELGMVLDAQRPDLVVFGLSVGGVEICEMLNSLAIRQFDGKVLLLGPRISPMLTALHRLGEEHGLAMLPILATPFAADTLRASVARTMLGHPVTLPQ
jgi:DNA-binding NtrC family response regulator